MHDGQHVKLDWSFLNLEYHKPCEKDSVTINDTNTPRKFCGYELPHPYVTPSNKVVLKFQSDKRKVGTGFKLHYKAVSGKFCRR